MDNNSELDGLLVQWQESKAAADALFGRHIADGATLLNVTDALGKPFTLKTLRQINKARKAERRAWDEVSDFLEEKLS